MFVAAHVAYCTAVASRRAHTVPVAVSSMVRFAAFAVLASLGAFLGDKVDMHAAAYRGGAPAETPDGGHGGAPCRAVARLGPASAHAARTPRHARASGALLPPRNDS